jgi:hypothetical protein
MHMFNFGWRNNAGLVHIHVKRHLLGVHCPEIDLHIIVKEGHRMWGHSWEEYDACMEYFGVGPLLLLCIT